MAQRVLNETSLQGRQSELNRFLANYYLKTLSTISRYARTDREDDGTIYVTSVVPKSVADRMRVEFRDAFATQFGATSLWELDNNTQLRLGIDNGLLYFGEHPLALALINFHESAAIDLINWSIVIDTKGNGNQLLSMSGTMTHEGIASIFGRLVEGP